MSHFNHLSSSTNGRPPGTKSNIQSDCTILQRVNYCIPTARTRFMCIVGSIYPLRSSVTEERRSRRVRMETRPDKRADGCRPGKDKYSIPDVNLDWFDNKIFGAGHRAFPPTIPRSIISFIIDLISGQGNFPKEAMAASDAARFKSNKLEHLGSLR